VIACLYVRLLALYITGDYGWLGYTSVGFSGVRSSTLSVRIEVAMPLSETVDACLELHAGHQSTSFSVLVILSAVGGSPVRCRGRDVCR
jgi:hypothetical protein